MLTDPIADMLTRIRNAARAGHTNVECSTSRLKLAIAKVLSDEGFIGEVTASQEGKHPSMKIRLRYNDRGRMMIDHVQRVSRPGRRVYVNAEDVPQVRNGLGMVILSTSHGVMCDRDARSAHLGGEVLCEVW